jgi:hypothetical protein
VGRPALKSSAFVGRLGFLQVLQHFVGELGVDLFHDARRLVCFFLALVVRGFLGEKLVSHFEFEQLRVRAEGKQTLRLLPGTSDFSTMHLDTLDFIVAQYSYFSWSLKEKNSNPTIAPSVSVASGTLLLFHKTAALWLLSSLCRSWSALLSGSLPRFLVSAGRGDPDF